MTKIMVVDDDPDIVYIIRSRLIREGYEVVEASSGEEALEKVKEVLPNIVLLDVMMPGMDGWETCRRIKSIAPIPIIIISVRSLPEDIKKSLEYARADSHIPKPIDFKLLISEIRTHINLKF
jgi:two-component system KDP operon response regulator KdpE